MKGAFRIQDSGIPPSCLAGEGRLHRSTSITDSSFRNSPWTGFTLKGVLNPTLCSLCFLLFNNVCQGR
jgi:hypothetical protein